MDIAPTFQSVVSMQQTTFLQNLSYAAQASEQQSQAADTNTLTDTAQNFLSINTGASWTPSYRGQYVDMYA